jgi:hypothetical protein
VSSPTDRYIAITYGTIHHPSNHPRTDIWAIMHGIIHHPSIHEPERLQVQSGQKEEALCCIETEEFMLHMFYQTSPYHPHFFTSRCIIPG